MGNRQTEAAFPQEEEETTEDERDAPERSFETTDGDSPFLEVSNFWENWKKIKSLGVGRTGEVVLIKPRKSRSRYPIGPFACKILPRRRDAMLRLFERECKILSRIDHPNCVKFHKGYKDSNGFYIITDVCTGGELYHRITTSERPLTEKEVSRMTKEMLLALQHIHTKRIVHRDLKPENFMFDGNDSLRLIDFGSALDLRNGGKHKELAGTPYYMCPEAVRNLERGEDELRAADIWSVGVITYVAMSRRPPFGGPNNPDIFTKILKYKLKWPKENNWSEELKDFLRKIIDKDPMSRMNLVEAIAHPFITGKPIKTITQESDKFSVEFTTTWSIKERKVSREEPLS